MRTAAITIHAAAAVAAFTVGAWMVMRARHGRSPSGFSVYFGALVTMALALFTAIGLDWSRLAAATKAAFAALSLLVIFTVWQAERARRLARATSIDERRAFIDRVGFTLVTLFAGFVIITSFDARAPGWVIAPLAIAGILAGRRVIAASRPASPRPEPGRDERPGPGRQEQHEAGRDQDTAMTPVSGRPAEPRVSRRPGRAAGLRPRTRPAGR